VKDDASFLSKVLSPERVMCSVQSEEVMTGWHISDEDCSKG
jgi:hypothetical protein